MTTERAPTAQAKFVKPALVLAFAIFIMDQVTKALVLYGLDMLAMPRLIEVTGFFNLVLVFNHGVSFGLFAADGLINQLIFSVISLGISALVFHWLRRQESWTASLALGGVIGGALGNVIDRLIYGGVVDFLDFHAFGYHWPAFNIADSAVVIGVFLFVFCEFMSSTEKESAASSQTGKE